MRAEIESEKSKAKKQFSEREAALNATIASLKTELESVKQNAQGAAKAQIAELEKKYRQKVSEIEGKVTALKKDLDDQKKLYEKSEADLRSHYESRIAELEKASKPRGFFAWLREVFQSSFGASSNGSTSSSKSSVKPRSSVFQGSRVTENSEKWTISKQDFEENKFGAIGYIVSFIGLAICWLPYICMFSMVLCPAGLISSIVGLQQNPKTKAQRGIVISIVGFVLFLLFYNAFYNRW